MFLFFVGMVEFLVPLNPTVGAAVTAFVCIWMVLVVVVTMAPVFSSQCPWKTTLLRRPLRWIRDYLFARYCDFDKWRYNRYRLRVNWHPRKWLKIAKNDIHAHLKSGFRVIRTVIHQSVKFVNPDRDFFSYWPSKMEEEFILERDEDMIPHFVRAYELAQNDEHLLLILGALSSNFFPLGDVISCLTGIHRIRQSHNGEAERNIGFPVSYGPSVVPTLIPLLVNKIQSFVRWSIVLNEDLVIGLRFLLDPYNEKFIDERVLWTLVGGLLKDRHLSRRTIEAFVESWVLIRAVPEFPQMHQSGSKAIVENVLVDVQGLLNKYVAPGTVSQSISATRTTRRNEGSGNQKGKEKTPAGRPDKPGILLDVMLSILSHANLSDIEEYFDLFSQTISDFAVAVRLMNSVQEDVAISLDFSIHRLNHLCQRLPSLTSICVVLVKELEFHLVQHYIQNAKIEKKYRDLQRILGISPHWRQVLERNGLLVAVDGIRVPGSGL